VDGLLAWPRQTRGIHKDTLIGDEPWAAKCLWCEQLRSSRRELDVDHYRPKVYVTEWSGDPPFVSDTPPPEIHVGPGYWWLAFEWTNLSMACKTCNQGWKRNLFPVEPPRGTCAPGIENNERPLLLDPASSFQVRDHFRWTIGGIMEPLSRQGRATIVTLGLNRRELLVRRTKVAIAINQVLDRLMEALRRRSELMQRKALAELASFGSRREEFTSMVRWFVEERLGCAWEELQGMPA